MVEQKAIMVRTLEFKDFKIAKVKLEGFLEIQLRDTDFIRFLLSNFDSQFCRKIKNDDDGLIQAVIQN